MSNTRLSLALSALIVLVLGTAFAGCGNSVPGNSVVKVSDVPGDGTVTKSEFDRWMTIAGNRSGSTAGAAKVKVPDFPKYASCVADKRKAAPKPAKGQPKSTDDDLKKQCKQQWEGLRDQVLGFLVAAQWLKGEAKSQGVKVSTKDLDQAFSTQRKQAFPKEKDFKKFLKDSGSTEADIRFQLEVEQLQQKLIAKITKGTDKTTPSEIASYYKKNKPQFTTPETRDLRVVLTKSEANAKKAKAELDGGAAWATVVKKYSTDPTSKSQGGKLPGLSKGSQEKALDAAIFKASKGKIIGPIKTQFGYYVFTVEKVKAENVQSLKEADAAIKSALAQQKSQEALQSFVSSYKKRWKERTNCREGYVIPDCKGGKTTTDAAAAAAAAGGQPQQAPTGQPAPTPAPTQEGGQ